MTRTLHDAHRSMRDAGIYMHGFRAAEALMRKEIDALLRRRENGLIGLGIVFGICLAAVGYALLGWLTR